MKNMKTLLLLSTSLLFVSCIKETKTVSKESNNGSVPDCYYSNSCVPGNGTTTTTTGTAGGGTGGSSGGPIVSYPVSPNWGVHYPPNNVPPTGSCSAPYLESGQTSAYDTRKATITAAGGYGYDPRLPITASYLNTSSILLDTERAKSFFSTDANLKVRIKVNPQPDARETDDFCFGRTKLSSMPGYTKLQFNVQVVGYKNGSSYVEPIGVYTVGVNSCTPAIPLNSLKAMYPEGVHILLTSVKSNQEGWWDTNTGFTNVNAFGIVPSKNCWSVELEVATDTTKTFN